MLFSAYKLGLLRLYCSQSFNSLKSICKSFFWLKMLTCSFICSKIFGLGAKIRISFFGMPPSSSLSWLNWNKISINFTITSVFPLPVAIQKLARLQICSNESVSFAVSKCCSNKLKLSLSVFGSFINGSFVLTSLKP